MEFEISGDYALFSDPTTRVGGEKISYMVPTDEEMETDEVVQFFELDHSRVIFMDVQEFLALSDEEQDNIVEDFDKKGISVRIPFSL